MNATACGYIIRTLAYRDIANAVPLLAFIRMQQLLHLRDVGFERILILPWEDSDSDRNGAKTETVLPLSAPFRGVDGSPVDEIPIAKGSTICIGVAGANCDTALWDADTYEMTLLGGARACIGFKLSELEMFFQSMEEHPKQSPYAAHDHSPVRVLERCRRAHEKRWSRRPRAPVMPVDDGDIPTLDDLMEAAGAPLTEPQIGFFKLGDGSKEIDNVLDVSLCTNFRSLRFRSPATYPLRRSLNWDETCCIIAGFLEHLEEL
ncbi:hypothetical protein A0H81_12289 [Grifola frondosa]|uniref:Uncharacterized protein n=1 Tax=Grifola frondosa TaxID=5627 RepID=A0A1C7LU18_GRIFR|nr:hypothetical protein A0H81_12289 [Grifola frondosa]